MARDHNYSANAPTLDAQPSSSFTRAPVGRPVALVEGSTPELSAEIQSLLRGRLRSAALLLALGFGAFFIRGIFLVDFAYVEDVVMWGLNGFVTAVLAVLGFALCRHCAMSTRKLRTMELLIFGLPALYFLTGSVLELRAFHLAQTVRAYHSPPLAFEKLPLSTIDAQAKAGEPSPNTRLSGERRPTDSPSIPWMMLIFIYAMYIPNTWQRAAVVIGSLAAIPVIMLLVAIVSSDMLADVFTWQGFVGTTLIMSLGGNFLDLGCIHDSSIAPRGVHRAAARPVSPHETARRWGDGRGVSGRTPAHEAPLRDQDHPSGKGY